MKNIIFPLSLLLLSLSQSIAEAQPNVIFFLADDVSCEDIGVYGNPSIKTPNIDAMAQKGLRFDNAYLTTSSCSPSRCSMITGRYPHNTGAPELHTDLPEGSLVFPKLLKDAGYYTVLSGKHHMGDVANVGFHKITKGGGPGAEEDWVALLKERPKDKPFFCWYASRDAHRAWNMNDQAPHYESEEMVVPPYLVDGPKTREDLTGYYHEVSRFDYFIGEVVAELKAQKIFDETIIIITSDNGRPFPRSKTRLYDSGIKPPFIVYGPNFVRTGVSKSLISTIDISATILDLADIPKPERIQGLSFRPIMNDPTAIVREVVFAEHNWHVYKNHERMVRFGDWLYIRNHFPNQQNLCMEATTGGAGEELVEAHKQGQLTEAQKNIFWNPCPEEELYHVSKDPDQLDNLAGNPEHHAQIEKMRQLLGNWTEQTGDSVPENPTLSRNFKNRVKPDPRGEYPGASRGAFMINHPGPIELP